VGPRNHAEKHPLLSPDSRLPIKPDAFILLPVDTFLGFTCIRSLNQRPLVPQHPCCVASVEEDPQRCTYLRRILLHNSDFQHVAKTRSVAHTRDSIQGTLLDTCSCLRLESQCSSKGHSVCVILLIWFQRSNHHRKLHFRDGGTCHSWCGACCSKPNIPCCVACVQLHAIQALLNVATVRVRGNSPCLVRSCWRRFWRIFCNAPCALPWMCFVEGMKYQCKSPSRMAQRSCFVLCEIAILQCFGSVKVD
jgi:hypothetical protein